MVVLSIQQGDVDLAFAHGLKCNVQRSFSAEKKVYALAKVGRSVPKLRNRVVHDAVKGIMKRRHREG